jgi:protein SCO1/2
MTTFLAFLMFAAAAEAQVLPSRLAAIRGAPVFALINEAGKDVSLADLRGRVVLVSFVFTTCNGSCPATTHRMCQVQDELKRRSIAQGGRVRLISITLDPARDTPAVLNAYASLYDADLTLWDFLSGPTSDVARVIPDWGMWTKPSRNGQLDHPSRVFLVDSRGVIREIYNLDFLRPQWVVDDIALLLAEAR